MSAHASRGRGRESPDQGGDEQLDLDRLDATAVITEEAATREQERQEALERDEAVRNQLGDITNLVQDQRDECARKRELMDERWVEKQTRREQKDTKMQDLYDMVAKIVEDREAEKVRAEEERIANEGKPGGSRNVFTHRDHI